MEETRQCLNCGGQMARRVEDVDYKSSGLDCVTLSGVDVWRCAECGEYEVAVPHVEALHDLLVKALLSKRGRLLPKEVRFMRTARGWSGARLAERIGVDRATVSRWESGDAQMPLPTERLFRILIRDADKIASYGERPYHPTESSADPLKIRLRRSNDGWERPRDSIP